MVTCICFLLIKALLVFIRLITTQKSLHAKQNTTRMLINKGVLLLLLQKQKYFVSCYKITVIDGHLSVAAFRLCVLSSEIEERIHIGTLFLVTRNYIN